VARVCVSQGAQLSEATVSLQLSHFRDVVSVDLKKRSLQSLGDELLESKARERSQLLSRLILPASSTPLSVSLCNREAVTFHARFKGRCLGSFLRGGVRPAYLPSAGLCTFTRLQRIAFLQGSSSGTRQYHSAGLDQLFQRCPHLEVVRMQLDLPGCEELPESLCSNRSLQKLEFWTLSESWKEDKLQSVATGVPFNTHGFCAIPESFSQLISLKTLHITLKENSTGHEVLFRMTALEELHLESCASIFLGGLPALTNLTELHLAMPVIVLPRSTSRLVKLKDFRLFCNTMADNPASLEQLAKLRTFSLVGPITSLPRFVTTLPSLTAVALVCPNLLNLPDSIEQWSSLKTLRTLDLYRCLQLSALPTSLSSFSKLSRIAVGKCIAELAGDLPSFSRLRRLDVQLDFVHEKLPDALSSLTQLQVLQIAACTRLSTLANFLPALSSLRTLNIEHCRELHLPVPCHWEPHGPQDPGPPGLP